MAIIGKPYLVTLYADNFQKKFVGKTFSWGFLYTLIVILLTLTLPFLLAFTTDQFWIKTEIGYENPEVSFNNKVYAEILYRNSSTGEQETHQYSTIKYLRDRAQNLKNPITITSISKDENNDGKKDKWTVNLQLRKAPKLNLKQASFVLGFNYKTQESIRMEMECLAVASIKSEVFSEISQISSISTIGTLELNQLSPMAVQRGETRTLYNDDVFNLFEFNSLSEGLIQYKTNRNETTQYNYESYMLFGNDKQSVINVKITVIIPTHQKILYRPNLWQVLKFAWVQYFSLFVLIYVLLYKSLFGYTIKNKVFDSVEISDINVRAIYKK